MHTATRLAGPVIASGAAREPVGADLRVRPVRAAERRVAARRSASTRCFGGEFEGGARRLGDAARREGTAEPQAAEKMFSAVSAVSPVSSRALPRLPKIHFLVPDRSGLPPLSTLRDAADARRRAPAGRLHRGQPRLPASVPALSGRADLRRAVPRRAARGRAGRRRRAGRGRRRAHHLRRSRFLQRSDARDAHRRRRCTRRIPASATTSRSRSSTCCSIATCCRGSRHRLRVRDERRRIARRPRAGAARQRAHPRRLSRSGGALPRKPASRWCRPSSPSIRG